MPGVFCCVISCLLSSLKNRLLALALAAVDSFRFFFTMPRMSKTAAVLTRALCKVAAESLTSADKSTTMDISPQRGLSLPKSRLFDAMAALAPRSPVALAEGGLRNVGTADTSPFDRVNILARGLEHFTRRNYSANSPLVRATSKLLVPGITSLNAVEKQMLQNILINPELMGEYAQVPQK